MNGIFILFVSFIGIVIFLFLGANALDANSMTKLGYETRLVNGVCYAKYKDRWLECNSVAKNQIEVIQK